MRIVLILSLLVLIFSVPCKGDDLTLVGPGQKPLTIHYAKEDQRAARSLAAYLKRITGQGFPMKMGEQRPSGPAILIGKLADPLAGQPEGDSYLIRVKNGQLHLRGLTPRATLMAVFAFLEKYCGCRWWSHNEEDIPFLKTVNLKPFTDQVNAVFRQTELMNNEAGQGDFSYKGRGRSTEQFTGSHTLNQLLKPYAQKDNSIYPYNRKTGKRAYNKLHYCYMNPKIADYVAEALEKVIKRNKGNVRDYLYQAGMGDWYGGLCECDQCRAVYGEEKWTRPDGVVQAAGSSTLIRMMNKVGEILAKKYPGVKVSTFAYMSLEGPPGKTIPAENVYIWVPHLRHCIVHGVETCKVNKNFYENLKRWCELAPGRVYVWDYGVNYGENFLYPFPVIHSMADNIKTYARLGVKGIRLQGNYVSTGGDLVVLKNWVWSRLMWNPELDTDKLIHEFCQGYYGPAADQIESYVQILEKKAMNQEFHINEFARLGKMRKMYLDGETEKKLRQLLQEALKVADGREPYQRRVKEVLASLEAVRLWNPGPLAVKDGSFVRTDKDGKPTWKEIAELLEHSRNASAKEWLPYRPYHAKLKQLHGGPLVTLRSDSTVVQVAPWLRGRIRQITFAGVPLLKEPSPKDKGYPLIGGAWQNVMQGFRVLDIVGEPTETKMTMAGDGGAGSTVKHKVSETIEMLPGNAVKIVGESLQLKRGKDYGIARCQSVTDYDAGVMGEDVRVQIQAGGQWQDLPISLQSWQDKVPRKGMVKREGFRALIPKGMTALRIRLCSRNCEVTDCYRYPEVDGGTILHNRKDGTLRVTVNSRTVDVNEKTMSKWLEREVQLKSLGLSAEPKQKKDNKNKGIAKTKDTLGDENRLNPEEDRATDAVERE